MLIPVNEWGLIITSIADGTQPATQLGTQLTSGTSNAYGSYTSVLAGASLTADAHMLEIIITQAGSTAADIGMLITVGFDPAGGTSFGGLGGVSGNEISNLLCSGADYWWAATYPSRGHRFIFPIFVKAGTSIGAKAQTNHGVALNPRVAVIAYCQPSRPESIRSGSFVRTFGADTATTAGTSVTQGTVSEGSWTSIGTAADTLWYLETGIAARSAAMPDALSHSDIGVGDGSNKRVVMRDLHFVTNNAETTTKIGMSGAYCNIKSGDGLYARSQSSAAQTGFSMCLYGVGG